MTAVTPNAFGTLLTNIVIAILILLIGFVFGKIVGLLLNKLISSLSINKSLKKKSKMRLSFSKGLSDSVSICIYILTVILAFKRLKILNLAAKIIILTIIILVLGAALIEIIKFITNLIFGINILSSKKFERGDLVKIKKIEGTVEKIGLSHTILKTSSGDIFVIANKIFFRNKFYVEKKKTKSA